MSRPFWLGSTLTEPKRCRHTKAVRFHTVQAQLVIFTLFRLGAFCAISLPLMAQYSGPAILSRGEAPAQMSAPQITFRPFAEARGTYDTGLAGVGIDQNGQIGNASSIGYGLVWGVSGTHGWKHSSIGINYRGSLYHYTRQTFYDNVDQSFLLYATHRFSPHSALTISEGTGSFTRDFSLGGLQQSVAYDPASTYIPQTDFFDNRTLYLITQVGFTYQKTRRLSLYINGDLSLARRRSAALHGSTVEATTGDLQYRLSRRSTIGAAYTYTHFSFTGNAGTTDAHTASGTYSISLDRRTEFAAMFGSTRAETTYTQNTRVDPVVAALLGISNVTQLIYTVTYLPSGSVRLSRSFPKGIAYLEGSRRVTPGNGLFLTSYSSRGSAGYNYTGLRIWSLGVSTSYDRSESVGNVKGTYSGLSVGFTASRNLGKSVHMIAAYNARQYDSPDFAGYHRTVQQASLGIGFTPGEVPMRLW
jgi:hypothetical protein